MLAFISRLLAILAPFFSFFIDKYVRYLRNKEAEKLNREQAIERAQREAASKASELASQQASIDKAMADTLDVDKAQLAALQSKEHKP